MYYKTPSYIKALLSRYNNTQLVGTHGDPKLCLTFGIIEQEWWQRSLVAKHAGVPFIPISPANEHYERWHGYSVGGVDV